MHMRQKTKIQPSCASYRPLPSHLLRGCQIALEQGVDFEKCLSYVKEARAKGLKAPVILMGQFCQIFFMGFKGACV
jgi:Tryptophan synthase alpha chain